MFLKIEKLRKSYLLGETSVEALRGLNLVVERMEFMALVGASGSGKSTLLNMIGCIDRPDSGSIEIDGTSINALSETDRSQFRSRKIGFIFQNFNLIPVLTVEENIELPLLIHANLTKAEKHERIQQVIRDVGLEKFRRQMPDRLSGGQRQRVAVARALVTEPALILADEPTANLDSKTAHHIIDLMMELNQKRHVTFVFSTHDEKLMDRVRRIVRIQDGLISSGETSAELSP